MNFLRRHPAAPRRALNPRLAMVGILLILPALSIAAARPHEAAPKPALVPTAVQAPPSASMRPITLTAAKKAGASAAPLPQATTKSQPAKVPIKTTPPAPAKPAAKTVLLEVPMVYQAPHSVWDAIHEETCEEASVLMIKGFLDGRVSFTRDEMETGLQEMVAYQNEEFGFFESTKAELIKKMAADVYGLNLEILPVTSSDDIKRELDAGRPVILPAAGRLLQNPNFKNGGPIYHVIVVRGYVSGDFITNDPGTRLGLAYRYPQERLVEAAHDWHPTDPRLSPKVMLVAKQGQ